MFGMGPWEIGIIAVVLVLLFGSRLPKLAGDVGRSIFSFKKGMQEAQLEINELEDELKTQTREIERSVRKEV